MGSELVQFGAMLGLFLAGAVAWFFVIYLPGRSMEGKWEGDRAELAEFEARAEARNAGSERHTAV